MSRKHAGRSMSMPAPLPPGLRGNHGVLTPKELGLAHMLCGCGQEHLFQDWADAGTDDDKKHAFFEQVTVLNDNYPDGIPGYVLNAQRLLKAASAGENPIAGVKSIEVPVGHKLEYAEGRFAEFEAMGLASAAAECCFVLVAGGLGERLGYGGIKVSLPTDLAAQRCYLAQYVGSILALQRRCNAARAARSPPLPAVELPLAIMLSGDTYDRTAALLDEHCRFGMSEAQLHLMLQQKVCSLTSAAGSISRASTYAIETKPHGHGDVHLLLCQAGLPARWVAEGRKWLVFFQDTNGLLFHTLPAALGVSAELQLDINSLAIPRIAGQEIGAITKLNYENGDSLTCNTEYNQIGDVLHALTGKGDVGDAAGYSPFPGNINQLLVKLDTYVKVLESTGGVMEEFVNPKYADETRTAFKKPTRLECMMQDYSKALPKDAVVGFTSSPAWINYSPCKNSVEEGKGKVKKGMNPYCAASAEADNYRALATMWATLGCDVPRPPHTDALTPGIPIAPGPMLSTHPSFAVGLAELRQRLPSPAQVKLSETSALVIEEAPSAKGRGMGSVTIEGLALDGALRIETAPGVVLTVRDCTVANAGWKLAPLCGGEPEVLQIRGYSLAKGETATVSITTPGTYLLTGSHTSGALALEGGGGGGGGGGSGGSFLNFLSGFVAQQQ